MAEGKTVIKVTWSLVALFLVTYTFVGLLLWGAVEAKLLDRDAFKYFLGVVGGSLVGGAVPLIRYWKEKRISFALNDSDPPATPNNAGDKKS
jgi:hypothetical protein